MHIHVELLLPNRMVVAVITAFGLVSATTVAQAQGGPLPPAAVTITPDPSTAPNYNLGLGTATRFIRVSGSGVARSKPTDARIIFLVSTAKPNSVAAMKYNDVQVLQVKRGLQLGGVPQENVSSSSAILVNPSPAAPTGTTPTGAAAGNSGPETPVDTAPTGGTGSPEGVPNPQPSTGGEPQYTAVSRLEVLTHEVSDVNGIEQIALNAGATGVLGIILELQPQKLAELKQLAIISAMKDAANKAEILALGVKVKVLYAISISEQPVAPDPLNTNVAPLIEIAVPMNIEVTYAIG